MLKSKRDRPRELGLAAKLAGVKAKPATKTKRIGKRATPRKLGLGARALRIAAGQKDKTNPAKHSNSYQKRKLWPDYKAFIADQVCIVTGKKPVEVCHCGPRGLSNKSDDRWCLPISREFHSREGDPDSQHRIGKKFWPAHGLDRDELVRWFNLLYAGFDATFVPLEFGD